MSQPNVDNAALESFETAEPTAVEPATQYTKQPLNIYTVMLVIAFVCLVAAIVILGLELAKWDDLPFPYKTTNAEPVFQSLISPFLNR